MRSIAHVALVSFVLASGCAMDHTRTADGAPPPDDGGGASEDTCTHPSTITYSTDALPAGGTGCTGNPPIYPSPAVPNPSAVYASGTRITLPFCNQYYPSYVADCTCMGDRWSCPL